MGEFLIVGLPWIVFSPLGVRFNRQLDDAGSLDVINDTSFFRARDEIPELRMNDGDRCGNDETGFQIEI
jgi:hypothetical protein